MRIRAGIALGLVIVPAFATVGAQQREYTVRGRDVAIYNLVGRLEVTGGTGEVVRVEVARGGPDGEKLRVEVGEIRGKESFRVIYPADRIVYREQGATGGKRGFWTRNRTELRVNDDGTFGDKGWGRNDVEIASYGRGFEGYADLKVSVPKGQKINLNLAAGDITMANVEGDIHVDVHAASVTTRATKGSLYLDTGSGEVEVRDAEGEVVLDTGSGSVEVIGMKGPSLRMDTGSGSLRGSDIAVEDLVLDSGSGGVRLSRVSATNLTVDTGSGSVEVDLVSDVDRLGVDTGSGGVTIGVPSALGAQVSIEAGSGGIDVDLGSMFSIRRSERGSLTGTIGDGRGRITIETGSGGVRLRPTGREGR